DQPLSIRISKGFYPHDSFGAEYLVTNFVDELTGPVARFDCFSVLEPLGFTANLDAETKISASPGKIEHEFGLVPAIDAKSGISAIKRTIEKFRPVLDDKISAFGLVSQGSADISSQIRVQARG